MFYTTTISRSNPSCMVVLVDQSGAMAETAGILRSPLSGLPGGSVHYASANGTQGYMKADMAANEVNRMLSDLVRRCTRAYEVRDYYHVTVIGYGAQVGSTLSGALVGQTTVPISEIATHPIRIEERSVVIPGDLAGEDVNRAVKSLIPVWVDPKAAGPAPTCQALTQAHDILAQWLAEHPDCFPPIVVHITGGGEATDGDLARVVAQVKGLASSDGKVLFFNSYLSSEQAVPVELPDSEAGLPDWDSRRLFGLSSLLPDTWRRSEQLVGYHVSEQTRGFALNASLVGLMRIFEIGEGPVQISEKR